jgi:hypothetical protein
VEAREKSARRPGEQVVSGGDDDDDDDDNDDDDDDDVSGAADVQTLGMGADAQTFKHKHFAVRCQLTTSDATLTLPR